MSRRAKTLLAFGLLAALAAAALSRAPAVTARELEKQLGAFFHREVRVGAVRFQLLPLAVEILDLQVGGPRPDSPPFLQVSRVVASPSLRQLWDGRIVLAHLRVETPTFRVNAWAGGGDDLPLLGGDGPSRELRVRRLVVAGGALWLNHERVPLELDLPGFRARLAQRRQGVLAGSLGFGPGTARFGAAAPLPVSLDADVTWAGTTLDIENARLTAEGLTLGAQGQVQLRPRLHARLRVEGPVDLAVLERSVLQSGFALAGLSLYRGSVELEGSSLRLRGAVSAARAEFDGTDVRGLRAQVTWDEKGLALLGLEAQVLGGRVQLDVRVPPPGPGATQVSGLLTGVDAEEGLAAIFDVGRPGVGSRATGEVNLHWPRGRPRELSGRATLDLTAEDDGRTPMEGRVVFSARDGHQHLEESRFSVPHLRARLTGTIARDRAVDLSVLASSQDIAASDALVARIRSALGASPPAPTGFGGAGSFEGTWRGTLNSPVFAGRVAARDVTYLGVDWGRAEWSGTATPDEVRSHSLVLRRAGAELWLDGRQETGLLGARDALDVRLRLSSWPATVLATALEWDVDMQGPLSGNITVAGRRSAPRGTATVESPAGRYYGVPYEALAAELRFADQVTHVSRGSARVGGGTLQFTGSLAEGGVYDGEARLQDLDVGAFFPALAEAVRPGGRVSGSLALAGPLARPRMEGTFRSSRIFLGDEGVGALEARVRGVGDGQLEVDARARSPRVDLRMAGRVGAASPHLADLRFGLVDTSVDPFLRVAYPRLPSTVAVVASATLDLRGPLARPGEIVASAEVREVAVLLPDYPVRNRDPWRLELQGGRLAVRDLHMYGEGTDLAVEGQAFVLAEGDLGLTVRGAADLRALSAVTRELRGSGAARLALAISGTRSAPVLDGILDVDGAGVRVRGFPHGLEDVRGQVRFGGRAAHFTGITGRVGGGVVELEGQAAYPGGRLGSFDVQGRGRGLALRYPEGLRSLSDADLRFFGDAREQWLTGEITVRQAVWTRRYDVASELLAASSPARDDPSLDGGVRYDVRVNAPGTLRVDNNLANLQARADLRLAGSYAAPVVLGRAEIERGRVYFQGNTYVIRRGAVDFANPQRVDPLFDIEAETRVRSYGVTLRVNGTLDRVYPTLTSDPPLSTVQIVSLLAGRDESDIMSLAQVQAEQNQLAASGAATLAAGRLSEQFGLERGAARLGLSRFSIDPSVLRGQGSPIARLTVGKRITPDLNIVYSQDVRGAEERLFSLEYTLSDRLSLLLTRAEPGGYGFDLRMRRTQ